MTEKEASTPLSHRQLVDAYLLAPTRLPVCYKRAVLESASDAHGECEKISRDLARWLGEQGLDARVLVVEGFRGRLGSDASSRWRSFLARTPGGERYFWHTVVYFDDVVIDLTGAQYGHEFSGIRILDVSELQREWSRGRVRAHHEGEDDIVVFQSTLSHKRRI